MKEALFDILGADVEGVSFLDLFAGTGSVGIEALSRGAAAATFVDKAPAAIRTVRENLRATGLEQRATVLQRDSFAYLADPASVSFEYVYVAPPQYKGLWVQALNRLDSAARWMADDAWAIVQIDPREDQADDLTRLRRFDERTYGATRLIFYRA